MVGKITLCEGNFFYSDTGSNSFPSCLEVGHAVYRALIVGSYSGFFPRECKTGMRLLNLKLLHSFLFIRRAYGNMVAFVT